MGSGVRGDIVVVVVVVVVVVGSRLRGSNSGGGGVGALMVIQAGEIGALMVGFVSVMVMMREREREMERGAAVLIRGGRRRCGAEEGGCRAVVRCLRLRVRRAGGR